MARRYSEGKAIDSVLRRIEDRDAVARLDDGRSPDDLNDPDPLRRVDYVCTVGSMLYAFEHTGIEPFGDQIRIEAQNRKLFEPIISRFNDRDDCELWELHVPFEASVGLTVGQADRVREALGEWITMNASHFPLTVLYDRYANRQLGETVAGVPFPVSLHRGSLNSPHFPRNSPLCGRFMIRYVVRNDLENARKERLLKACQEKFPKLAAWKAMEGARTVLVLEENDLFLTNHSRVFDALVQVEPDIPNAADEIFLVSTAIVDKWWVTCLRRANKTYYDDSERFHDIDPNNLVGLTRR